MFPARAFHARPPPNGWLLDSGASTLITSRKADMFGMAPGKFPISALASTESASARGTVCLQFAPDKFISMPALLVENATTNLVPFSPFIEAGYSILATKDGAVIFDEDSGEILCRAPADKSGMFWLTAVAVPLPGHSAKTARPTALPLHASTHDVWHARLNHPSERTLHEMARHNMVIGLVFTKKHKDEFPCLACLHGRMTYGPVTSPGPHLLRTVKDLPHDTLDVVFVDVYGPLRTSSAGYRYIILSYIGSCRVLRVDKLKTLVLASMQAWLDRLRTRLSKETNGLRILCIHSDSFSTFVALSEYAASHGIYWDFSRPPKHCFVAERQVRRFMESFRCAFLFSGLPRKYWVYLLPAIEFTLNLQPFEDAHISRFQQLTKFRPDGSPLRVIGCAAYPKTFGRVGPDDKSFAPRIAGNWVLLGYTGVSLDIDGYACLEMSSGKILNFNLWDVKFDESVLPFKAGALNHTDDLDVELDARGLDALGRPPDLAPFDEADPELLPAATPRPSWPPLSGAPSGLVPELRSAEPHPHEEESWTVSFLDPSPPATSTTVAATRQAASRHPPAAPTAVRPR